MTTADTPAIPAFLPAVLPRRRVRRALRIADALSAGTLTLLLPDGTMYRVARSAAPAATIVLRDMRAIARLLARGSLGFAEAYIDGFWDSPDLRAAMRLAAANEEAWDASLRGRAWMRAVARVPHLLRWNTRAGAARNVAAHYDLGNDFYALWLDPSMTYSSAMFADEAETLHAAQIRKMRRLCEALRLAPGLRVLEIGCGWGGFAEFAAREYGVRVTAVTLSPAQHAYASARIAKAGLSDAVEIRLQDYRDVAGAFDRIVCIEMLEAVGEGFWPVFFRVLRDRLHPGGRAGLQTIAIADRLFGSYRRTADFIQRHVFPGGMLPCPRRLKEEAARAGFAWEAETWFGRDYARTLRHWQSAFHDAWPRIVGLGRGHDARFKRLWDYYLAYCEVGFDAGWTDVGQIILRRA